ncbi:hypothetical protein [Mesorhizobium delmotii]|nr:hypothetical protein [Mesorhizobium delmotii]
MITIFMSFSCSDFEMICLECPDASVARWTVKAGHASSNAVFAAPLAMDFTTDDSRLEAAEPQILSRLALVECSRREAAGFVTAPMRLPL